LTARCTSKPSCVTAREFCSRPALLMSRSTRCSATPDKSLQFNVIITAEKCLQTHEWSGPYIDNGTNNTGRVGGNGNSYCQCSFYEPTFPQSLLIKPTRPKVSNTEPQETAQMEARCFSCHAANSIRALND